MGAGMHAGKPGKEAAAIANELGAVKKHIDSRTGDDNLPHVAALRLLHVLDRILGAHLD